MKRKNNKCGSSCALLATLDSLFGSTCNDLLLHGVLSDDAILADVQRCHKSCVYKKTIAVPSRVSWICYLHKGYTV